jgi:hypothetical protein
VIGISGIVFTCLVVGHLALATFFPSVGINILGLMLLGLILYYVLIHRRDVFGFILIIFAASHFNYAANQGGMFNLLTFLLLSVFFLMRFKIHETLRHDVVISGLLWILLIHNLLGWILVNPASLGSISFGAMAFGGYLLMFHVASNVNLSQERLRKFIIVIGAMVAYNFIVSLNHHYSIIKVATPLLALTRDLFYATSNAFGVFGNSSVNGEYNMMMFALLVPLLASSFRRELNIRTYLLVAVAVLCLATIVISNTRGSSILAVAFIVLYGFLFSVVFRRAKGVLTNLNIILVFGAMLVLYGSFFGNLARDLEKVGPVTEETITSGKALNRFGIWQVGWHRLTQENWLLGHGHGIPQSNSMAWGGATTSTFERGDRVVAEHHLHNLYLAIPMLYGWGGAFAFLLLIFVTMARLIKVVTTYDPRHYLVALSLGFLVAWFGFLVEEIKSGVMVQVPHYPMIVWIWLGLSNAAVKTLKMEKRFLAQEAKESAKPLRSETAGLGQPSARRF